MTPFSSVVPGTTSSMRPFAPGLRVLPPNVYDTIELMALAFRGIGAGSDFRDHCPNCVHGLAREAGATWDYETDGGWVVGACPAYAFPDNNEINQALMAAGIERYVNDDAVEKINQRLRRAWNARVTFRRWCRQLGVVRGEA